MSESLKDLFLNKEYLAQALTHKSYANEAKNSSSEHNEKLEFLGDAVLDLVIGELLMRQFTKDTEGGLSKKRASIVNENVLCEIAVQLSLQEQILLGKGEAMTGGATKPRLLASVFEAVVGALFLDQGFEKTREFIRLQFQEKINQLSELDYEKDYKTRLQELVQKEIKETPVYDLISEEGPPHDRIFHVSVKVRDEVWSQGTGKSKKMAEQKAAQEVLRLRFKEKI